jgi:phosphoglycolate phosphatase-like HAD superfamily hydrolase
MSPDYSDIRAVLLDWDDTCVGTIEPIWLLHKHIAATYYNKQLTDEELKMHWGKPMAELAQSLYETDDHKVAIEYILKHKNTEEYYKKFFHKVPALLGEISIHKKLGLLTAGLHATLHTDFSYLGFDPDTFHYIQTAEATKFHKPDPRVFEPAIGWLKSQGITARETLYVGDSFKDHEAAVGAGLQFIAVTTGLFNASDFQKAGIPSVDNLFELEDVLDLSVKP